MKIENTTAYDLVEHRKIDYLEVERSGLSMEISKLKKEGIINSRKNYFELL